MYYLISPSVSLLYLNSKYLEFYLLEDSLLVKNAQPDRSPGHDATTIGEADS